MDRTIVEKAHELIGLCVAYEDKYRSSERPGQALEIAELRMAVEAALLPRQSGGPIETGTTPGEVVPNDSPETVQTAADRIPFCIGGPYLIGYDDIPEDSDTDDVPPPVEPPKRGKRRLT